MYYKVSPTWLPKRDLNKNDTNGHVKVDARKSTSPQPYTKDYRQLRDTERKRV